MIPEIPEQAKHFIRDGDMRKVRNIEWDVRDWEIWYHCIGFALWQIARRNDRKKPIEDFQI